MSDAIVIVSAARTPMGGFQGDFVTQTCAQLGSAAIRAAVERATLKPSQIDEVIMGCVLPAGQGQAPARQAALGAGLPLSTGCTTINKMCGSGMRAAMFAHDMLLAGSAEVMVAGGMESMTNAPYLLPKARAGMRLGHSEVKDHMFLDGLEDAYDKGRLMGSFAEECADSYKFTREAQGAFAVGSSIPSSRQIRSRSCRRRLISASTTPSARVLCEMTAPAAKSRALARPARGGMRRVHRQRSAPSA